MREPIIPYLVGTVFHIVIVFTNLIGLIFSISWVLFIFLKLRTIENILKRLNLQSHTAEIIKLKEEQQTRKNKYCFFLSTTVLEACHVSLRLMTFSISSYFDFVPAPDCKWVDEYRAYDFITSRQPYQFIWISLAHCFVLSLMTTLIMTILFLRESYSYFEPVYDWVWRWASIGLVQFILCWALLLSPYTGLVGSILYILFVWVDYFVLIAVGRKLYALLLMRLIDLQFDPIEWGRLNRGISKFRRVSSVFMLSFFIYIIGIICSHLGIWVGLSPCYFEKFFSIQIFFTLEKVQLLLDIASIIWLADYIAVIQFDLVLICVNIVYIVYSRMSYRDINEETRRLVSRFQEDVFTRN